MKFSVGAKVMFHFLVTEEMVKPLMTLSERHYDAVCREASSKGFLSYWHRWVEFAKESKDGSRGAEIRAEFGELDTVMKIMEQAEWARAAKLITDEQYSTLFALRADFTYMMTVGADLHKRWKEDFES